MDYALEVDALHTVDLFDPSSDASYRRQTLWCLHASLLATSAAAGRLERQSVHDYPALKKTLEQPVRIECPIRLPITHAARAHALDFEEEWELVYNELYERRNELVERVLDSHMKAF